MKNLTMIHERCDLTLPTEYDSHWIIAYVSLAFVGLFYGIFGYRCWRLTMFITSFALSSLVIYIVLKTQPTLNEFQLIMISCSIAILFGLVNTLLEYIGLFTNGFCFGLILSIITFVVVHIKDQAAGTITTTTIWFVIGLILILGLICATLALRFQKFMLIIMSSCLAGVCQVLVLDYFLQLSTLFRFTHTILLLEKPPDLCFRHWIIILIQPIIMLLSISIQYSCTGRNYDHRDSWHKIISTGKKHYKTANLNKIRRHYERDTLRQQIIPDESNRFRHFYHLRRAHGDALSSDFIQNMRQQSSTAVCLTSNNTINTSPIIPTGTRPSRKTTDSTTTTLTHLI
ncbi:unnamed protein product [Rotaria socialis]|uniref:Transmembrane protein 198 n=2 Tax=Rotaria socialis TaxID=392032 RepID=A0A818FJ60_9BILA|nr:unnamed protein product [Rotaria socialis]CAF3476400.1 unnamed protein product [Rotaria socialis]CAF3556548.1 unnamed protein product [Rotaria socialis]CAF3698874.1 unnamed protein product [Rotaria socialis]CAF4167136.1 unnamed protein product [Rotaria socialis]